MNEKYSVPPLLIYSVFVVPVVFLGNSREYKTMLAIPKSEFCWGVRVNGCTHSLSDGGKGVGKRIASTW